jgi:hypothetical protein
MSLEHAVGYRAAAHAASAALPARRSNATPAARTLHAVGPSIIEPKVTFFPNGWIRRRKKRVTTESSTDIMDMGSAVQSFHGNCES